MTQRSYLYRLTGRRIRQVREFFVAHPELTVRKGNIAGLPYYKGTGKYDRKKLRVMPDTGLEMTQVPATAAGLKSVIRRLRPEEGEELDELDAEIERLRARREEVLKKAWDKAHVVTLKEALSHTIGRFPSSSPRFD